MLQKFFLRIGRLSFAWLVTFILASILHTQTVLAQLSNIDVNISISDRLSTTYRDLTGLASSYGLAIFVGFVMAFTLAWFLQRRLGGKSRWWYGAAGGAAIACILFSMQPILNVTLLASARSTTGIMLQACAGICGGFVYASLRNTQQTDP